MPRQVPINCLDCGKAILAQSARAKRCALCSRRRNARLVLAAFNQERKSRRVHSACQICGKVRSDPPSRRPRVVCSMKCRSEWAHRSQLGPRSHRWQGGKTAQSLLRRMSLSYASWRTAVFRRDDYTCQMCRKRGSRLTAHHILQVCDRPDLIYSTSNGITLCWPCHTSIRQSEAKYVRRFRILVNRNESNRQLANGLL